MSLARKIGLALAGATLLASCTSAKRPAAVESDEYQILQLALQVMEADRPRVTIVLDPSLNDAAKAAAERLRHVVLPGQVPATAMFELPPNYLRLSELRVDHSHALVMATLGPVPEASRAALACGINFEIPLRRDESGRWSMGEWSSSIC